MGAESIDERLLRNGRKRITRNGYQNQCTSLPRRAAEQAVGTPQDGEIFGKARQIGVGSRADPAAPRGHLQLALPVDPGIVPRQLSVDRVQCRPGLKQIIDGAADARRARLS
jgi:hypothetical protein